MKPFRQDTFDYFAQNYGLTLLESELDDIEHVVKTGRCLGQPKTFEMNMKANPIEELEKQIRDALALSESCKASYAKNGHGNQYSYARGQIDSFKAVLNWINDSPHRQHEDSVDNL